MGGEAWDDRTGGFAKMGYYGDIFGREVAFYKGLY